MLDCRGLACPQPVMRAKELIEADAPEEVSVLVDNAAASQNVSRFLTAKGYAAKIEPRGGDFLVSAARDPEAQPAVEEPLEAYSCATGENARTLVFIRSDTLGRGDDGLGAGLMKNFILTLGEMGPGLWRIMFVNSGVKLCCEGAETLPALSELVDKGVSILVCGTCLTHFGLLDAKKVGETTNMLDIVTSLAVADKVVTI